MRKITICLIMCFLPLAIGSNLFANEAKDENGNNDVVTVSNLEELRQQEPGTDVVFEVTGEVILTYQHGQRNQKYVQDATAAIIIDDDAGIITTEYEVYDGITGLKGKLSVYANLLQLVPVEDPGAATSSDNHVDTLVIGLDDLTADHQAMLVRINDLQFEDEDEVYVPSKNYDIFDPTGDGMIRTRAASAQSDYFGLPVRTGANDMVALVDQFNENMQIFPRSLSDIYTEGIPEYTVTFNILDEVQDPIDDAVITFDGDEFPAGVYVFEDVPVGIYSYKVEREDFYSREGEVVVVDDKEVTVILLEETEVIDEFPWVEDFEDGAESWNIYHYGALGWEITDQSHTGDHAAWHNRTDEYADSWAVTPQFKLPEDEEMVLTFFENNAFMPDYGYSAVKISTGSGNPALEEFVEVWEADQAVDNYTERIIDLTDYAGQVIFIAFVYQGEDAHRWFVDDIVIEEKEIIEVENIAGLFAQQVGDLVYEVTGEVFITHQQQAYRGQIYIQDGSGAIMIDDPGGVIETEYENYDGITGIRGTLSEFQDMLQLVPVEDPGAPSSTDNEPIEPVEMTLEDLSEDHQAMLVIIRNVSFDFENQDYSEGDQFTHNTSYYIFDATGDGVIRTPNSAGLLDYFDNPDFPIPTEPKDIVGVLHQRFDATRLQPRSVADFKEPADDDPNIVEGVEGIEFKMYPNPANNYFNIESAEVIQNVRVFNINGQMLMDNDINNNNARIDISALNPGIYIVQVISGSESFNFKLQVQR